MKLLSGLLGIALLVQPLTEAQAKTWTITADEGGLLRAYHAKVMRMNWYGDSVRIDGPCYSACTLYLGVRRLCITERAVFYFHKPWVSGRDYTKAEWREVVGMFNATYPIWVRNWARNNNAYGSVEKYKVMPAAHALKYIPKCK